MAEITEELREDFRQVIYQYEEELETRIPELEEELKNARSALEFCENAMNEHGEVKDETLQQILDSTDGLLNEIRMRMDDYADSVERE